MRHIAAVGRWCSRCRHRTWVPDGALRRVDSVVGSFTAEGLGTHAGQRALTMLGVVPEWLGFSRGPHLQADYSPREITGP
jgi:hypothetical protein